DLPGIRSMMTDSACIARHRSSARPVILLYLTPASGLNSYVVTTGPGWIWATLPSTENSRHFSSSSRAPSINSRSSILRSPFAASSSASGGSVKAPFLRSAGDLSTSESGSVGSLSPAAPAAVTAGRGFLIGGGVGLEDAAFNAEAAAPTRREDKDGCEG